MFQFGIGIRLLILCSLVLSACGFESKSQQKNIFGTDNRELITSTDAPYNAIGRIEESGCTATLIGRRTILTAAHCLWNEKTSSLTHPELTFSLAVRHGIPRAQAKITAFWLGSESPESQRVTDFAVAHLASDLSGYSSPVAVGTREPAAGVFSTNMIAYSQDFAGGADPAVHRNCKVHEQDGSKWFHECDGTSGMSGAPLVDVRQMQAYVIGLAVSEYRGGAAGSVTVPSWSRELSNVAISASQFADLSQEALLKFDQVGMRGSDLLNFKYYTLEDLNHPPNQLPDPNPSPIPIPDTEFRGNWALTESGNYLLIYPNLRVTYLSQTRAEISAEIQNISALQQNLISRFGPTVAAATTLGRAKTCLNRLDYLVSFTNQGQLGYNADQEISRQAYPCIQNDLKSAYAFWLALTDASPASRPRDVPLWNKIFLNHRFVFLDLYNGRRNI